MEKGLDYLGKENKYNFMNKFSAKKMPDKALKREKLPFLYSWTHYAPQAWYEYKKKEEEKLKEAESNL